MQNKILFDWSLEFMQQLDTFHYSTRKNKWTKRKSENEPDVTITIFI